MKLPSKGTVVYLENGGSPLFAGGVDLDTDDGGVLLKYEGGALDEGYGRGIVELPISEFQERRVHPEQLPDKVPISDVVTPNKIRQRLEDN